jgi:polyisoprenoid-binding protein YceI
VVIPLSTFSSDNDSRDSNMLIYCKAFDFPSINFESKFIYVNKKSLEIEGVVDFAGKKKELKTTAQLNVLQDNKFSIQGEFEIMLSDFDIKRPSFLFVKIEDSILIKYSIKGVVNE